MPRAARVHARLVLLMGACAVSGAGGSARTLGVPGHLLLRGGLGTPATAAARDGSPRSPPLAEAAAPAAVPRVPTLSPVPPATRAPVVAQAAPTGALPRPAGASLRLGNRRGVIRALKKGFGFIRMDMLPGEPSPTDVFFDYAEQDAARVKFMQPGSRVLFVLNLGPKRVVRAYGVTLEDEASEADLLGLPSGLRQAGLPGGFRGREPKKSMGPFAWGEESIHAFKERKYKRKLERKGQPKKHDAEGFPLASLSHSSSALPPHSLTPTQAKAERLRRRAIQKAARKVSVVPEGEGGAGGGEDSISLPLLPQGWERRTDEKGRTYYIDWNSKTSSWGPPPGYTEPAHNSGTSASASGGGGGGELAELGPEVLLAVVNACKELGGGEGVQGEGVQGEGVTSLTRTGAADLLANSRMSPAEMVRGIKRLFDAVGALANSPLVRGLYNAQQENALAALFTTVDGLKALHRMVIDDINLVHDHTRTHTHARTHTRTHTHTHTHTQVQDQHWRARAHTHTHTRLAHTHTHIGTRPALAHNRATPRQQIPCRMCPVAPGEKCQHLCPPHQLCTTSLPRPPRRYHQARPPHPTSLLPLTQHPLLLCRCLVYLHHPPLVPTITPPTPHHSQREPTTCLCIREEAGERIFEGGGGVGGVAYAGGVM
jgi:cold shock CspA family protein